MLCFYAPPLIRRAECHAALATERHDAPSRHAAPGAQPAAKRDAMPQRMLAGGNVRHRIFRYAAPRAELPPPAACCRAANDAVAAAAMIASPLMPFDAAILRDVTALPRHAAAMPAPQLFRPLRLLMMFQRE